MPMIEHAKFGVDEFDSYVQADLPWELEESTKDEIRHDLIAVLTAFLEFGSLEEVNKLALEIAGDLSRIAYA